MLFTMLARWLRNGGEAILSQVRIPGVDLLLAAGRIGLEFALMDWARKAELSGDRAALVATQNPDAAARSHQARRIF